MTNADFDIARHLHHQLFTEEGNTALERQHAKLRQLEQKLKQAEHTPVTAGPLLQKLRRASLDGVVVGSELQSQISDLVQQLEQCAVQQEDRGNSPTLRRLEVLQERVMCVKWASGQREAEEAKTNS